MADWSFSDIILEFLPNIVLLLLGGIVPIILSLWAKLKKSWTWIETLICLFLTITIGLVAYNNIPYDWPIKSAEIEKKIRKWMLDSHYMIKSEDNENEHFKLIITDSGGLKIGISSLKKSSPSQIRIYKSFIISEDSQKQLQQFNKKERKHINSTLKLELLKYGIQYIGISDPLKKIILMHETFISQSTTKNEFLKEFMFLRRASYLVKVILSDEANKITNGEKSGN
jgi:hypothetical protein